MRPPSPATHLLAQVVSLRDALVVGRGELRNARTRAAETREAARRLRAEAAQLRATGQAELSVLPLPEHR